MRRKRKVISASIALILTATLSAQVSHAQTISAIKLSIDGSKTELHLEGVGNNGVGPLPAPNVFMINGEDPRIVADFKVANTSLKGRKATGQQKHLEGGGHITSIRYAPRGKTGLRFVFDLEKEAHLISEPNHARIIIKGRDLTKGVPNQKAQLNPTTRVTPKPKLQTSVYKLCKGTPCPHLAPHRTSALELVERSLEADVPLRERKPLIKQTAQTPVLRYFSKDLPYPRLKSPRSIAAKRIKRRPVIVIDAGHGGRDPGAIGTRKTREKDITYKASLELQKRLLRSGRYTVILTRNKDVYIEHAERLRIARAGGADLFISIHADSTKSTQARGASVYTLADRAKNRSKRIVSTQNWIMDVDLGEQSNSVGDILVDLAQRTTATQSDEFADLLLQELKGNTRLIGNSHRKAGYYVLLAPDVPAVLLELGFLSNPDDELLLRSDRHRAKILRSVHRALDSYFKKKKL